MKHIRVLLAFACALAYGQRPNPGGSGGSGVGPENQSGSFTAATSVTITDNLNTLNKIAQCVTTAGAPITITDFDTTLNTSTITFASSTGSCRVNGTGGIGQTGPAGADGINGGAYSHSFSYTGTPLTLTAATHGRGATINTKYKDDTNSVIYPYTETIDASGNITFSFASTTTGTLMVSGGGAAAGAGNRATTEAAKAATAAGTLNLTTDGTYLYFDNGSTLTAYGPVIRMYPPVLANYTWVNQSTSTSSSTYGGIDMKGVADSTLTWRMLCKTAPAPPYTVDISFRVTGAADIGNMTRYAAMWRQASTAELSTLSVVTEHEKQTRYLAENWDSATAQNGSSPTQRKYQMNNEIAHIRLVDNNTNRESWVSSDGTEGNWVKQGTGEGRTVHLTADQLCVGFATTAQSIPSMKILSWYEH